MSLISELQRRNVLRSAFAYLAISWLLIQIVETILPVFGFDNAAVRLVVVVLAIGFVPALVLSWVFEWTPDGFKRDDGEPDAGLAVGKQAKTWDRVIILALVVALSLFAFDRFVLTPSREARLIEEATDAGAELERAKAAAIPQASVAVLPFVNMSGDSQNEYFSDGLTENLLHMLAQLADLKVSARTSSFTFKGRSIDLREIAALLGVAHVLEGSVQKAANRVRITAQLIRASDGFHLWSRKYDRDLDDIFAIQDEIANDVASSIGSELLAANPDAITGVSTTDVGAFDLYLKALDQQATQTEGGIVAADTLLREALAIDQGFLDARVSLARNNIYKEWKRISARGTETAEAASLLVDVLAERPDDAVARSLLLFVRVQNAANAENIPLIESLLEDLYAFVSENSGDPLAINVAVNSQMDAAHLEESLAMVSRELVADPLNSELLAAQAGLYELAGRPDDALVPLLTAVKANPENLQAHNRVANKYLGRGDVPAALDWFRKGVDVDPMETGQMHWKLGMIFYSLDLVSEGDYWLEELRRLGNVKPPERTLEIFGAVAREDADQIIALTAAYLGDTFSESGNLPPDEYYVRLHSTLYAYYMHADNRSQEALEFFMALDPGKLDYSTPPASLMILNVRGAALSLQAYMLDEDEFQSKISSHVGSMEAMGIPWLQSPTNRIIRELWINNDMDAARNIFLADMESASRMVFFAKINVLKNLWMSKLLADPAVAERLAELADEDVEQREAVLKMLRRPEWRDRQSGRLTR